MKTECGPAVTELCGVGQGQGVGGAGDGVDSVGAVGVCRARHAPHLPPDDGAHRRKGTKLLPLW